MNKNRENTINKDGKERRHKAIKNKNCAENDIKTDKYDKIKARGNKKATKKSIKKGNKKGEKR